MKMTDSKKIGRPALGDMPMTPAQRQKLYRSRMKRTAASFADDRGQGSTRIDVWLPSSAAIALKRMSIASGYTQSAMLTLIIIEADKLFLDKF
jgi:hypothetical protein